MSIGSHISPQGGGGAQSTTGAILDEDRDRISPTQDAPADLARRISSYDWSSTPLGPISTWPQSLQTATDAMLASGHAMCLAWGPERTFLYNDAYAPMLGARHPHALGKPFEDVWPDVWPEIAPLVDRTFAGETSTFRDMPLLMTRNGYAEDTWWSFSYSPIRNEQGEVGGLLNVTLETTGRVLTERQRDKAVADLSRNEAKWRTIFETLREGFIHGEVIRNDAGEVVDWRYDEVNDAWYDLVGIERGCAVGRTIREVFPGIEDDWVLEFARVVDTRETIRFTRQVGTLGRWYDGVAQPAADDRFTVIFTEVTDRVLREQRNAAILELSDRLQDEGSVENMAWAASEILGRELDVELVGYGDVDPVAETITTHRDWTAGGARPLGGTVRFRDYGSYVDDLKAGQVVVVNDAREDTRTRENALGLEARSARAFVNAPVIERGIFVAMLFVCTAHARSWTDEEVQFIRDVAYRLRSAIERLRAVEQQEILNGELAHRIKNTLSVVQAIAMQTLARSTDPAVIGEFSARLKALSSAHDVLLTRSWSAAGLHQLIESALETFALDRVSIVGPDLGIGSRTAMSLSLLIHELATNAVKYGALSVEEGSILIEWAILETDVRPVLEMTWTERGGPPAVEPTKRGFGSRIIRMGLTGSGGVKLDYASGGLTVEMTAPLDQVQQG